MHPQMNPARINNALSNIYDDIALGIELDVIVFTIMGTYLISQEYATALVDVVLVKKKAILLKR
jgi:hypothetical protein